MTIHDIHDFHRSPSPFSPFIILIIPYSHFFNDRLCHYTPKRLTGDPQGTRVVFSSVSLSEISTFGEGWICGCIEQHSSCVCTS
ncbi:hypothetical protein CW304_19035 [Bacillus sp. UFRGS-B20]|nr:hypothetical protein CW304_19035 [Bacillus sp. UFRGS-B20]